MPYTIPTLTEIATRVAGAFGADLKGSDAKLWPNNVAVSSKVIGGAVHELFDFIRWIAKQALVHTADDPQWIEKHAAEYGMALLPAAYAEGKIDMTGDNLVSIPEDLILQRADGVQYKIIDGGGVTNGSGEATVRVRALEPGKKANALEDVALTLTSPFSRINSAAAVNADGIGLGADPETHESLRQRVWARKRLPPHGGAKHDYVAWAREYNPGITRVFVDPVNALNERSTIGLWFLMDDTYPNGIPQSADVTGLGAYIDEVKPAGAVLDIGAPAPIEVDITITGVSPNTQAVRDAVMLELAAMFRREAKVSTLTEPFRLYRSLISEAISVAIGEHHHVLTTPNSDVLYGEGQIPVMGEVTFA